jgi:hypothetical protein
MRRHPNKLDNARTMDPIDAMPFGSSQYPNAACAGSESIGDFKEVIEHMEVIIKELVFQ